MNRSTCISIFVALVAHASLFWLSFAVQTDLKEQGASLPIVLEVAPAQNRNGGVQSVSQGSVGSQGGKGRRLTLSDLGIRASKFGALEVTEDLDPEESPERLGQGSGPGDGTRGTALEGIAQTVSTNRWFEAIDSALHYPKEFLDHGIGGKVDAEFFFAEGKRFDEARTRVRSKSRYLRVHILRMARSVFAEPVLWVREGRRDFILVCEFQFDPTLREAGKAQDGIKPRILVFYRYGEIPGQWRLGPIRGVGIAPAVGIDPNWFVEQLARKSDLEPLEKYRRDPAW